MNEKIGKCIGYFSADNNYSGASISRPQLELLSLIGNVVSLVESKTDKTDNVIDLISSIINVYDNIYLNYLR